MSLSPNRPTPNASLVARIWAAYVTSIEKNPIRTKMMTTLVLSGGEEACSQALVGTKKDSSRVAKMALYGGLVAAPMGHYLYKLVGKLVLNAEFYTAPCNTT